MFTSRSSKASKLKNNFSTSSFRDKQLGNFSPFVKMKRRKYNRWRLLWTESRFSKGWRKIREKTQVLRRGLILIAILIRVNSWSLDSKENSKFPFILLWNVALKHLEWKKKYLENQRQDNRVLYGRVYCQWGPLWTRQPTKKTIQSKGPLMILMAQSVLVLSI